MADSKQGQQLNGAFYGPPVPPRRSYRSVGGRSGCGPCCLFCTLFKFLISIVIVLGIIVLVVWLVFRPNDIKVHVNSADLSQFNLSASNNLQYDLALNMSIRNPNRRIGIYYDSFEAQALYDGSRFAFATLPTFYQGHKNTTDLQTEFKGQQLLLGDAITTYNTEKGEGDYNIDVKLYPKLRLKVWIFKIHHVKPKIDCSLKLPAPGSGGSATPFQTTRCHVSF